MSPARWSSCVRHRGDDVGVFLRGYLGTADSTSLLVGGAGFDPRTKVFPEEIRAVQGERSSFLLIEEVRPNPDPRLQALADTNRANLLESVPYELLRVRVVDNDGAVIAGRQAVEEVGRAFKAISTPPRDVFIDFSALSVGIAFTLVRYFLDLQAAGAVRNVHVLAASSPRVDLQIRREDSETATPIHGFEYHFGAEAERQKVRLWVPLLRPGMASLLTTINSAVSPHEVVPVLPFPSRDPRLGDKLLVEYRAMLENDWAVEPRDLLYASEDDPLDIYRLLLRVHDLRAEVFGELGGSKVVLSPTGSKRMAIGLMMAAIDREMPVVYLETLGYRGDASTLAEAPEGEVDLMHIWLAGDAYGNLQ